MMLSALHDELRLMPDLHTERIGDEAKSVGAFVKVRCQWNHALLQNRDAGSKQDVRETTFAIGVFGHGSCGFVRITGYHHAGLCGKMQEPQHMAGRNGGQQQVLRIMPAIISPENNIA